MAKFSGSEMHLERDPTLSGISHLIAEVSI